MYRYDAHGNCPICTKVFETDEAAEKAEEAYEKIEERMRARAAQELWQKVRACLLVVVICFALGFAIHYSMEFLDFLSGLF